MSRVDLVVGILAGIVQGVVEWLPVSSQGNLALFLTAVGTDPDVALQLALFLQVGTTLSAATYYREDIRRAIEAVPGWRPDSAYDGENALISYILVACTMTGLIGIPLYIFAVDLAGELSGAVFVGLIGVLLVLTGGVQLTSESVSMGDRRQPTLVDSVLVGAVQGIAILPGISRSGVTSSALLFRSYDPPEAFRLSFILSIPASLGAAALTVAGAGGLPGINPDAALAALLVSAVVGYLMIGTIMRVVDRVPFWVVCFGLGGLAILGGVIVFLV
jgi:undecaprenyl-diphosphatase